MKLVDQLPQLGGKRVFIRVDFNVPIESGKVGDTTRIDASLPTIRYARERGAKVILASHLGRPKGKRSDELSLRPVAAVLGGRLNAEVGMAPDCVGPEVSRQVEALSAGAVLMLENLRFHAEEEKNDDAFSRALAELADIYVNDAFGAAHRAHASTVGMVPYVGERAAGFLLQRECEYLGKVLSAPERPLVAILGGAKVSDKIPVIQHLLERVDAILIGGAMAYTFLRAQGHKTGNSLVEEEQLSLSLELLAKAKQRGVEMLLPVDHVVAERPTAGAATEVVEGDIPDGKMGLDVGPRTLRAFRDVIRKGRTIFWNGPLGKFETEPFDRGTMDIARALAESSALTIVGGGDSVAALSRSGQSAKITHISTGGGASLEFLEGKTLPASRRWTEAMAQRVPLLAGNWKMYGPPSEARALAASIRDLVSDVTEREVVVAPAFPALTAVAECLRGTRIGVAGQNLHWEDQGAFTGEVSAPMLVDAGCTLVIIGHSERRTYFGETDELVARRIGAALRHRLKPIVCVGETLAQRQAGEFLGVIQRQIHGALDGFAADEISRLVIAYEPVWAIGTGHVASPEQAQEVHREIRRIVSALASPAVADGVRILYGGSVKPDNIDDLMRQPDLDGALVGGASLKAQDFDRIVRFRA